MDKFSYIIKSACMQIVLTVFKHISLLSVYMIIMSKKDEGVFMPKRIKTVIIKQTLFLVF